MTRTPSAGRKVALWCALAIIIASALWQLHIIDREMPSSHADLQIIVAVRAALHRRDPYSDETTRAIQTAYYGHPKLESEHFNTMGFAYPPHTVIVLAPLALLDWPTLRLAFLIVVPVLVALSVPTWLRVLAIPAPPVDQTVVTILTLGSWAFVWALRQQQPTLIVAILIPFGLFALLRRWNVASGMLLACATIKPQLVGPMILWLMVWAAVQRRWTFLLSLCMTTAALLASATWLIPGWPTHWAAAMADYTQYMHVEPVLQMLLGTVAGAVVMLVLVSVCAYVLWCMRHAAPGSPEFGAAVALALAATLAVTPTTLVLIYNQMLLVPALLVIWYARPRGYYAGLIRRITLALLAWGYLATVIAAVYQTVLGPSGFMYLLPCQNVLLIPFAAIALAGYLYERISLPVDPASGAGLPGY